MKKLPNPIFCMVISCIIFSCSEKSESEDTITKPEPNAVTEAPKAKAPKTILGIDVSHFQGDVNWQEIKDANIIFVYDKATEGATFTDPKYAKNKVGAHEYDLAHGSYHFYTTDSDPIKQAEFFTNTIDYGIGDMPPVLDLEKGGIKGTVDPKKFQEEVLKWLNYVEQKLGVKPVIYTNHTFGDKYLTSTKFEEYQLWIAEYGVETPKVPKIWDNKGWLIWQRSERGAIEGAISQVDHDLYNPKKSFEVVKK
ncbi:glycoside hydrolase family 25 protein [Algoriphagus machipongonensis]|uniref:Glycosyl hydrolase, family 25 n=1 Tax=Algoriphagus machipongonensis TaxID=388413 RepID=A3HS59_9BACT|nr:glycoside hydrolase family 25 protein [Algoriphagus machipongonensis]EAZ82677.1 glycosyl hydrolase, family 25 [Algoriphagus machipongonensis]